MTEQKQFDPAGNREAQVRECQHRLLCGATPAELTAEGYAAAAVTIAQKRLKK
jgi:hypothetical protein